MCTISLDEHRSALLNPLTPGAFCEKGVSWTFWWCLGWISAKLVLIWSKMHLHHDSLAFLPLASRFATFWLGHAQKSKFWDEKVTYVFRLFDFWNFFWPFLFLSPFLSFLLQWLAFYWACLRLKTLEKASSRWATFTMEQPGVVAANFGLSFSLHILSIFVHISGSIRPITLIWASLERSPPPAGVEHRWCQFWSKVMTSEVEERPRLVTAGYGRHGSQWVNSRENKGTNAFYTATTERVSKNQNPVLAGS